MSLEKVSVILREAEKNGHGVLAYNAFNYESVAWLIEAAEEEKLPVIIMMYPTVKKYMGFAPFAAMTRELAKTAKVSVGLHLDHSSSFEEIMDGIRCGFSSVMIDASSLPYEENIAATCEVVKAAHALGIDVEGEIGHVGVAASRGDFMDGDKFTQPDMAADFARRTGIDYLAVAIGSAHGNYVETPKLDFTRLSEIKNAVDVPLVLHGGTGIPEDQIREAIRRGIVKVNVGTEYGQLFYEKAREAIQPGRHGYLNLMSAIKPEIMAYLRAKMDLMRG